MPETKDEHHSIMPRRRFIIGSLAALTTAATCMTRDNVDKTFSGITLRSLDEPEEPVEIKSTLVEISDSETDIDETKELIVDSNVKQGLIEEAVKAEGKKWLGKLSGNGGRDTVIYIPEGTDISMPLKLIIHFHGTNGHLVHEVVPRFKGMSGYYEKHHAGQMSAAANRLSQVLTGGMRLSADPEKNVVIVYPISAGRRGSSFAIRNGYDDAWMKTGNSTGDDIFKLYSEIQKVLSSEYGIDPDQIKHITGTGHSAGGAPLKNIAMAGFPLDKTDFYDASYSNWAPECYKYAKKTNPDFRINVYFRPDRSTNRGSKSLIGKAGVRRIPAPHIPHSQFIKTFFPQQ